MEEDGTGRTVRRIQRERVIGNQDQFLADLGISKTLATRETRNGVGDIDLASATTQFFGILGRNRDDFKRLNIHGFIVIHKPLDGWRGTDTAALKSDRPIVRTPPCPLEALAAKRRLTTEQTL